MFSQIIVILLTVEVQQNRLLFTDSNYEYKHIIKCGKQEIILDYQNTIEINNVIFNSYDSLSHSQEFEKMLENMKKIPCVAIILNINNETFPLSIKFNLIRLKTHVQTLSVIKATTKKPLAKQLLKCWVKQNGHFSSLTATYKCGKAIKTRQGFDQDCVTEAHREVLNARIGVEVGPCSTEGFWNVNVEILLKQTESQAKRFTKFLVFLVINQSALLILCRLTKFSFREVTIKNTPKYLKTKAKDLVVQFRQDRKLRFIALVFASTLPVHVLWNIVAIFMYMMLLYIFRSTKKKTLKSEDVKQVQNSSVITKAQ